MLLTALVDFIFIIEFSHCRHIFTPSFNFVNVYTIVVVCERVHSCIPRNEAGACLRSGIHDRSYYNKHRRHPLNSLAIHWRSEANDGTDDIATSPLIHAVCGTTLLKKDVWLGYSYWVVGKYQEKNYQNAITPCRTDHFYPLDAMIAQHYYVYVSVCQSQAGIVSKRLHRSSWFLAYRLHATYGEVRPCMWFSTYAYGQTNRRGRIKTLGSLKIFSGPHHAGNADKFQLSAK